MRILFRRLVGGLTEKKTLIVCLLFLICVFSANAQCPPVITANPPSASVCAGDSVRLSVSPIGALTYQWYQNGVPIVGATDDTLYVKVNGSYTVLIDGCASPSSPINVAMKPLPQISISSSDSILCSGTQVTLTVNTSPNVTWVWISPPGIIGSVTNPLTMTLTNTTTFQVVGADQFTICANIFSLTIPVVPLMLPGAIQSDAEVCSGGTPPLITGTPGSGGSGSFAYQWQMSITSAIAGFTDIPGETGLNYQPGVTAQTTWYRRMVSALPCPDDYTNVAIVQVNPTPMVISTTAKMICSGVSVAYSPIANIAGSTFTWTASVTSGIVSGFTALGSGDITDILSLPAGSSTSGEVTYIITPVGPAPTSCVGIPMNLVVTVNPIPLVTITILTQDICAGETTTTLVLQSNVGSATFIWTASATVGLSGFQMSGSGDIPAMQIFSTLLVAGTVTYTIIPYGPAPNNCNGTSVDYVINVNPSPSITNTPMQQTICSGATTSAVILTSNMPTPDFTWNATAVPASVSGYLTSGTNTIPAQTITNLSNVQGVVTFNIVPSGGLNGCSGIPRDYLVYVDPLPVAMAAPGSQNICSGQSTNISLTSNVANTTFTWTASGPGTLSGYSNGSGTTVAQIITNSSSIPQDVTYVITPTSQGCVGTSLNVIITVSPTPALTINSFSQTICSGETAVINLTGTPANASFTWTASGVGVTGFSGGTGVTISQTLTNNTNIQCIVVYSITTSANGCATTPVNYTVIVNPIPVVTNSPFAFSICSGTVFNLALTSNVIGTSYTWTTSGSPSISGFSDGSGNIISQTLFNTANAVGSVVYTITPIANGCAGTPVDYTVTVNPMPNIILSLAAQSICSGTATTLVSFASAVAGTTYNWLAIPSNAGITGYTASGTASIPSQIINSNLSAPGTVSYTVTPSFSGCIGSNSSHIATINPLPVVTNTSMAQDICSGATSANVNLLSNVAGTSFSWIATPSTMAIIGFQASGGNSIPPQTIFNNSTTPGTITYQITPTSNFGPNCEGTIANYTITVDPIPSITSSLISAVCSGQPFTYTISSNLVGDSYTWSRDTVAGISNPPAAGYSSNISEILTNTTLTDIVVTYILTPIGQAPTLCMGISEYLAVTVHALPQVNAGFDLTIPYGTSTLITGTTSGGTGALSYVWAPNAYIASGANTLSPYTINLNATRIFTLSVNDTIGCSSSDEMTVFITGSALASIPTATPSNICLGQSSVINASATGGSGTYSYAWISNPAGFTSTLSTATVSPIINTVYSVTVNDGFNIVISTVLVNVNPLPVQYGLIGGGSYCIGGPGVNVGIAGTEVGITYQLYNNGSPVGFSILGNGGSLSFGNQTLVGTYTVVATWVSSGCTIDMGSSVSVSINSLPVVYAGADQIIPFGTNTTLNGLVTGGFGVMNYSWTPPAFIGMGANTPAPSTTNLYANTTFTLDVIDANGCAGSDQISVSLSGSAINVVATATPSQICADTSQAKLQATVSGGSGTYSFSWTCLPAGSPVWSSMQQNPMVSPDVTTNYIVVANDGFNTAIASVTIIVNSLPLKYGVTGGGSYCVGYSGVNIGLSGSETNVDYQLLRGGVPDGPPVTGTGNPISFGNRTAAFTYTVLATNNLTGCINLMNGSATVIIITPPATFLITGGGSYPFGGLGRNVGLSYSNLGISYQLYCNNIPVGTPIIGTDNTIDFGLQTQAGTYTVVATDLSTGCTADMSGSVDIFILPLPVMFQVTGGGAICVGEPGVPIGLNGSEAGVDYQLLYNGFPQGALVAGTNLPLSWGPFIIAGLYEVRAINSTNGIAQMMQDNAVIFVSPLPTIFTLNPAGSQCAGTILRLNGSESGFIYYLLFNGITIDSIVGTGVIGFLDFGPQSMNGNYTIRALNPLTGCEAMMNGSATIMPLPVAFNVIPAGIICASAIVGLDSSETGVAYTLYKDGTASVITIIGTGSPISFGLQTAGNYTIYAVEQTSGCSIFMFGAANIGNPPIVSAGSDFSVCSNQTIQLNGIANYTSSINWTTLGNGTFSNVAILNPIYTLGSLDIISNSAWVVLHASGNGSCATALTSDTLLISVTHAPIVNAGPGSTICNTCAFSITGASASNNTSILWTTFGNGTFSNPSLLNPTYQPSAFDYAQGFVYLKLTAYGNLMCSESYDTLTLRFSPNPTGEFTVGPACALQPVSFMVDTVITDINAINSYNWDFGDGSFSPLMNPLHTFVSNGPFNVTLLITDTIGNTNAVSHSVTITPLPISFFSYNSPNCANQPIQFTDRSHTLYGYVAQWIWDYGDGSPGDTITFPDEPNMTHLYNSPGTYNVTLYITNSAGCNAMFTQAIIVTPKPYSNFYFSGNCEDQIVSFTDASYPNGGGNVVGWAWDFGDPASGINNTSNLTDPTHSYSSQGTYNVTLVITNFNNCHDTIVKAVTINLPPIVDFVHGPVCLNSPAEFFADSLVINVNAVSDWLWDFADGGTSTSRNTVHPFASPGIYLVSLTITDTVGCTNTITHPVNVNPLPVAHFDISDFNCVGQKVFFENLSHTSVGYIVRWNWNFGDGSDTTISFPSNASVLHTFATGGIYTVTLTITASDSCTAIEGQSLTILPAPEANFDYDLSCFGIPVNFSDISQSNGGGMIIEWLWDFGDLLSGSNNSSVLQNPQHQFYSSGLHVVTLTVGTTNGCKGTAERIIQIVSAPLVEFTVDNHCEGSPAEFKPDSLVMDINAVAAWLWDFGDGFTSPLPSPEHIYTIAGMFQVKLTITDSSGCSNSASHQVLIIPKPIVNFGFNSPNCYQDPTYFTDNSIANYGYIIKWNWDFGDGTSTTINFPDNPDVSHQYTTYGFFNITLTVTTNDSCSNGIIKSLTVSPSPMANFGYQSACAAGAAIFDDQSQIGNSGIITDWLWNFGDPGSGASNTSALQNPMHTYATAGSYQVSLIVISSFGCSNTITKSVIIAAPPTVNFVSVIGCINDSTQFTSSIFIDTAAVTSWLWSFGDGGTSSIIDPYHIYNLSGTYTVMLTITDTTGCTNSVTHTAQVTSSPIAYFNFVAPLCPNYPLQFTDLSTSPNGQIVLWHWDFGDGSDTVLYAPAIPDITHTYQTSGIYNVSLGVFTSTGCENTFSQIITLTSGPLAGFSSGSACRGSAVTFADLTTTNGGNTIITWMWNFGDPASGINNTSTLQNPQHIFMLPGDYTVSLNVINASGCMDTTTNIVEVHPLPAVDFGYGANNCQGLLTQFNVDSLITNLPAVQSFDWDFGDGTAHSYLQNPSHLYGVPGIYTIILSIIDIIGCGNQKNHNLEIHPVPKAIFTFANSCLNSPTQFTDHSFTTNGEEITGWHWDFGDIGNTDTSLLQNPSYNYTLAGTYQVLLTVTSASGCSDTIMMPVQVNLTPTALFSYTADPCANGAVYFQDSSFAQQSTILSWMWEFEPYQYSNLQNPTYVYYYADSCYNVKLTVTDMQGCSNTILKQVCVPTGLDFDFSATETCFGAPTYFTPQLIAPIGDSLTFFWWNFGDAASGFDNTSILREPSHLYSQPGTYIVSLKVKDINQCTSTKYRQVVVSAIPEPEFSYLGGNCDSTLSFRNLTNTNGTIISSWIWQFGDGTSDTIMAPMNPNVSHSYPNPGIFYVIFTSISELGCRASFSDTVRIFPCMVPEFHAIDTLICQHKAITFADSSAASGSISNWFWDFGDNSTTSYSSPQPTITHIYQSAGTYTVKLVITIQMVGGMKSDSVTHHVKVNPGPDAKYNAQDVCLGIPAKFTNSTSGNGTQISGYSWMFGEPGTLADTSSAKHATYLYKKFGDFDATLVATNTIGCSDTITHTLTVNPLPIADFQYSISCAGALTHFTDVSDTVNSPLGGWKWDFMDSTRNIGRSGLTNPDYLFANEGNFTTRLIITDNNGCQDTMLKPVVTHPVPINAFEIKENYENVQGQVQLSNGTINATGYEWDFGNGFTSTDDEPSITYNRDGSYKIKLISYNDFLCSDTLELLYKLMFKGLYVPNAFSPENEIGETLLFKPVGMNIKKYRVDVYNSWGNLLWSSTKLDEKGSPVESWDGTYNGNLMPQDVYIWKIEAIFNDGTVWNSTDIGDHTNIPNKTFGTVTLLR